MKLWGSVRKGAGKLAFEAEKAVRVKREESAISSAKAQIEAQSSAMGKAALALAESGELDHPQLMPFVQEIARIRLQIAELEQKVAEIQAEEFTAEEEETTVAPPPPEPISLETVSPEPEANIPPPPPPPDPDTTIYSPPPPPPPPGSDE